MVTLMTTILIFFKIFYWLIIIDIILSWISLISPNIRPKFLADLIDPIYSVIKKYIPTTIWGLDFTPIIILLVISFIIHNISNITI